MSPAALARHQTTSGARLYTLPVRAFPGLQANAYLLVVGPAAAPRYTALIDVGSQNDDSHADLISGLERVVREWGEQVSLATLSRIVITHAHPDHVAGLPFVQQFSAAPVAAHRLDVPAIETPEVVRDAFVQATQQMIGWAGLSGSIAERMGNRARNLAVPSGVPIQTVLEGGELLDGVLTVVHTPGHAAGQVCLRVDEVLLSADHLLPHNSPPLWPSRMREQTGLAAYLDSLDRVEALSGVTLALGGHGGPMTDWRGRIAALRARYDDKLAALLAVAREPLTVAELTERLYPELPRVQALLLHDQTGALAEYLAAQGRLTVLGDRPARFVRAEV